MSSDKNIQKGEKACQKCFMGWRRGRHPADLRRAFQVDPLRAYGTSIVYYKEKQLMNKKILITALVLGSAVTYCILKLAGTNKVPKMNAKAENQ